MDSLKTSLSQRKAETVIFREVWVTGERTCVKEILYPNLVTPDEATPSILPVIHKSQGVSRQSKNCSGLKGNYRYVVSTQ